MYDVWNSFTVKVFVSNFKVEKVKTWTTLSTFFLRFLTWHFKKRKKSRFFGFSKKRKKRILELWFGLLSGILGLETDLLGTVLFFCFSFFFYISGVFGLFNHYVLYLLIFAEVDSTVHSCVSAVVRCPSSDTVVPCQLLLFYIVGLYRFAQECLQHCWFVGCIELTVLFWFLLYFNFLY